ncbi:hypothetical protein K2173_016509 [Erythroxylum novogranatense]|uniref:GH18 domain-containing protein n=1 Tax=Erythroxylum novogranatense TaxID=1862640 RepID=A0AAV8SH43_9ROSI|nr:hypothetical protein K2173_016509 [Erythroxylum novogranatense]
MDRLFILLLAISTFASIEAAPISSKLFREYIGAEDNGVKFSDVPIDPRVEFHFILSFAIDYTSYSHPVPSNGNFQAYWDTRNLSPSAVEAIKSRHRNVKVAMSLGGDSINNEPAYFKPKSVNSWVTNAIRSITGLVKKYHLDGIDIDYEHFKGDPETFAECIGQLLLDLKQRKIIKFASIAPYEDSKVQEHYLALWRKYGHVIDYVNLQFYALGKGTTVPLFLQHFRKQSANYKGGKVLASFATDGESGGLSPKKGFFSACDKLRRMNKLHGIFVWSADDSKKANFKYEVKAQKLLAKAR